LLYIKPDAIVTPTELLEESAVLVDGDRIVAVGLASKVKCPPGAERLEAEGLILAPGFIDLQINGAFGRDFTADPETIWEVAARLPQDGVTAFLPTIITSPPETIEKARQVVCGGPPPGFKGATPLGLHLEGPFLNPAKRGAHKPEYLRTPDLAEAERCSPKGGVRMVTLAPELAGAGRLIQLLAGRGVLVSAGHSMATLEEGKAGIEAGIRYGTHLFNAMPALDHREPGIVGALLSNERVTVGLIADGVHLHPEVVALAWRMKGPGRVSLVTDAMAALGMGDGRYSLGDADVIVEGMTARLTDGRLAGSVLSLDAAVRNLVKFTSCSIAEAIGTVTSVPASLLGLERTHGQIAPGFAANLTLLTPDLQVALTMIAGNVLYDGR